MMRTVMLTVAALAVLQASGSAQFGFGGFGESELKVVARYDKDGDGRLNLAERKAARAAMRGGGGGGGGFNRGPGRSTVAPGAKLAPSDIRQPATTPLYDLGTLRTIFLEFENPTGKSELAAFYNTDVEVPATMTVDGKTYQGRRRPFPRRLVVPHGAAAGFKRSLNLSIDFVNEKQDLGGYQTLNLLNANNDPTFLRACSTPRSRASYLPTPKANYVRVVINGESWGVYVNVAAVQQRLRARARSTPTGGARWKVPGSPRGRAGLEYLGDDPAAYRELYEIKTKDDAESWAVAHPPDQGAERDAARQARGGAGADPRHRRRAAVPRPRSGAGQQRRLLDARQRLQPVSRANVASSTSSRTT